MVIVTQRGAVKRMLAQELNALGRAKRGLMVLRELKKNPHRVLYMGPGEDRILLLQNQKGQLREVATKQVTIGELNSNGSLVLDEKEGGTVISVHEIIEAGLPKEEPVI